MHLDVDVELQARGLALCRLRPGEVEEGWGRGLGRKFPRCAPAPTTSTVTTPRPASSFSSASRRNLEEVELEEAAAPELRRRESTSTVCTAVGGE